MKKMICAILALTLALGLTACGKNTPQETTGAPAEPLPGSALEVLETVWADYAEDEKFPVIGGSTMSPVDGGPGSFDITDENIRYNLLIPEAQLASITEAASMIHMMNANTFTAAAYRLADGVTAADFASAMQDAITNNQWMCGFPDELFISAHGDQYVVVAFGLTDVMASFAAHMAAVHPGFAVLIREPIA